MLSIWEMWRPRSRRGALALCVSRRLAHGPPECLLCPTRAACAVRTNIELLLHFGLISAEQRPQLLDSTLAQERAVWCEETCATGVKSTSPNISQHPTLSLSLSLSTSLLCFSPFCVGRTLDFSGSCLGTGKDVLCIARTTQFRLGE